MWMPISPYYPGYPYGVAPPAAPFAVAATPFPYQMPQMPMPCMHGNGRPTRQTKNRFHGFSSQNRGHFHGQQRGEFNSTNRGFNASNRRWDGTSRTGGYTTPNRGFNASSRRLDGTSRTGGYNTPNRGFNASSRRLDSRNGGCNRVSHAQRYRGGGRGDIHARKPNARSKSIQEQPWYLPHFNQYLEFRNSLNGRPEQAAFKNRLSNLFTLAKLKHSMEESEEYDTTEVERHTVGFNQMEKTLKRMMDELRMVNERMET